MGRHGEVLSNAPFSEKGDELVLKTRELLILMSGLGKLLLVNAFQAQNCLFKRRVRKGSSGPGLCADMRWGQLKLCGVVGTNTTKGRELTKVEGRRTRAGKSNLARANEGGGTEDGLDMRGSKEMEAFRRTEESAGANTSWRDGGVMRDVSSAGANTSRRTDEAEDGGWTEEVPEDGESEDGWRGWRMEGGIT
ncbi:hypothetical protein DFP72DRAFT_856642 [Ephemerocybe angulata]|uniref:Uncharacterized protein n=1 Tax=Ephemerocybe angulata TaxID=980116 RepID=A0A8H6HFB1_9AGAR|nr:hypothetical protein DFP72DRAFT_856642 [Tulosesus angulatus]